MKIGVFEPGIMNIRKGLLLQDNICLFFSSTVQLKEPETVHPPQNKPGGIPLRIPTLTELLETFLPQSQNVNKVNAWKRGDKFYLLTEKAELRFNLPGMNKFK